MLLNGSTLNGATLNGGAGQFQQVQVAADQAYIWALRVIVGGVDRTADVTGSVEVDREEGAAGVAQLALYLAESPITPSDWVGRSVTIDYLSQSASGSADVRRFTGQIAEPAWSPLTRVLSCQCTDSLQQRVEALSVAEIDSLIGGYWSADLYDPVDGHSHWDYAQERLESLPASLDCSPSGALRVTGWYALPAANYVFGAGTTIYESVQVDLPLLSSLTNVVEIEYGYRFSRLWQHNQSHNWTHPDTEGLSGIQGWCVLMTHLSTELPDRQMVESAVSGIGQTLLSSSSFWPVPSSGSGVYCNPIFPWTNNYYPNLLLGFGVTGARRWVQPVTEKYTLRLEAAASVAQAGEIVTRDSLGFTVESDAAEAWESTPFGIDTPRSAVGGVTPDWDAGTGFSASGADDGSPGHSDHGDAVRREAAARCLLQRGLTEILAAHRATSVVFGVPTSLCAGVDLPHTVRLDDQGVRAQGKVRRIVDRFDLATGVAVTSISLAVMRGGGDVADPLVLPPVSTAPAESGDGIGTGGSLPTQIGGKPDSPPHDPEKLGFSGNLGNPFAGSETYPREVKLAGREIAAELRDELIAEVSSTYRIAIPNDLLEL